MKLFGIARKKTVKGPMEQLTKVAVTSAAGIEEDCRGKGGSNGKRQVTVLSLEQWQDACADLATDLPWTTRRANLCVSGYSFGPSDMGRKLTFQNGVVLEITGETDPCNRMDEAHQGLRRALIPDWRGGVTCRVLSDGLLSCEESVTIN